MLDREETRQRLTGFVPSFHTIFDRDGAIDWDGCRRFIEFLIEAGSQSIMITPGDSLYALLSDQEVVDINRLVVEQTAGRALVIAAAKHWWTGQSVEYAKTMREVGADLLITPVPDWATSHTPDSLEAHYTAVAQYMPVMLLTPQLICWGLDTALATTRRLRDRVPQIVAAKEDWFGEFGRKFSLEVHGHWSIIGGGEKENHMNAYPYGIDGYLSTFVKFLPRVTHQYWHAIQHNDLADATKVIAEYDMPWFDFAATFPDEYDSALRGAMELFGAGARWRRPPFHNLTDAEMERLRGFLEQRGWL